MARTAWNEEIALVDLSELECLASILPDGPIDISDDVTAMISCC